jgi:hypothetical protein
MAIHSQKHVAVLNTDNCHFMIKIVVFIDWLIYYCIDTTQRDGSYEIMLYTCFPLHSIFHCKLHTTPYEATRPRMISWNNCVKSAFSNSKFLHTPHIKRCNFVFTSISILWSKMLENNKPFFKKCNTQHSFKVTEHVVARYWGKSQRQVNTNFGDRMSKSRKSKYRHFIQ